jgi:hypothetical protein
MVVGEARLPTGPGKLLWSFDVREICGDILEFWVVLCGF